MHVCMHVCMYVRTYVCMYACMYVYMHVCTSAHRVCSRGCSLTPVYGCYGLIHMALKRVSELHCTAPYVPSSCCGVCLAAMKSVVPELLLPRSPHEAFVPPPGQFFRTIISMHAL